MSINKNNFEILNSKSDIEIPNKLDIESLSTSSDNNSNELKPIENKLVYGVNLNIESPKMLGNTYSYFFVKGNPLIIIGPDYSYNICMIGTISLFYWLEFFTIFENNFKLIILIESLFYFSFMFSYSFTAFINPGIPDRYKYHSENFKNLDIEEKKNYYICEKCNIFVPKKFNTQHCYDCNICVMEFDHHCPWTGKCIGKKNIYSFYIFIVSLFLYIFSIVLTFMMYLAFLEEKRTNDKKNKKL